MLSAQNKSYNYCEGVMGMVLKKDNKPIDAATKYIKIALKKSILKKILNK